MFSNWNMGPCPPNQGQEVDWGVLAQQWIKQKEMMDQWQQQQQWAQQQPLQQPFIPPPPPPPPPPEEIIHAPNPDIVPSEPETLTELPTNSCPIQQENNFLMPVNFTHKHSGGDRRHDPLKVDRSWHSSWGSSWSSSWSGPSTHRADYNHGIPFTQSTHRPFNEDNPELWHGKQLSSEHSLASTVEEVITQPPVDVKKRKLPAWIREGLEKIEREKNRKMLEEVSQNNLRMQHKSTSQLDNESDSVASAPSSEDSASHKIKDEATKNKNNSSDEETGEATEKFIPMNLTEEERIEINMSLLKRCLTEVLLDITNSEMRSLIEEVVSHAKAQARQLVDSTALSRLADVGFSSSNESNASEESESELQRKAEFKRAEFEKNQQLSHGRSNAEKKKKEGKKSEKKKTKTSKSSVVKSKKERHHRRHSSESTASREKRTKNKRDSLPVDERTKASSAAASRPSDSSENVASTEDSNSVKSSSTTASSSVSSCSSSSSNSTSSTSSRSASTSSVESTRSSSGGRVALPEGGTNSSRDLHSRVKKKRKHSSSTDKCDSKYSDRKRLNRYSKERKAYRSAPYTQSKNSDKRRSNRRNTSSDDSRVEKSSKRYKYSKDARSKEKRKRSRSTSLERNSSPVKRSSPRNSTGAEVAKSSKHHRHSKSSRK